MIPPASASPRLAAPRSDSAPEDAPRALEDASLNGGAAPGARPADARTRTRVAVIEEDDLLRYGLIGCLSEDQRLEVTVATPATVERCAPDVAIASGDLAREHLFPCPVITLGDATRNVGTPVENDIAGALHHRSLTVAQLLATVHAARAGLRVETRANGHGAESLGPRAIRLIELIADGCSTREIAVQMSYSERTIKKMITEVGDLLDARSRPQMVAKAIRRGII